jgi:hypothetical protein
MSVWCRQSGEDTPTQEYIISADPHPDLSTDLELLHRKAAGAADKGWEVEWVDEHRFIARKNRWGGIDVTREFWVDP